jgi:hypothetical protein
VFAVIGQFTAFRGDASVRRHLLETRARHCLSSGGKGENRVLDPKREPKDQSRPKTVAILAPAGEYWTIGYPDRTFPLKDYKGLSYIHRLLQHPGEEFHALDLLGGASQSLMLQSESVRGDWFEMTRVADLGDAGEMLDVRAKQEYRRRLIELREEFEQARALDKIEQAARIETEIEFLEREISRAVGLGGRNRRAGSAVERARLNVTRAIKSAIDKIGDNDAELGRQLVRSIRTGHFCSYHQESSTVADWQFVLTDGASTPPQIAAPVLPRRESAFTQELVGRTSFVGREAESATLDRVFQQASASQGRIVVISGPPGVGKTRITAEFCANASGNGAIAYLGGCSDREDPVPFLPFVEILEAALRSATAPHAFRAALGAEAAEIARLMPQLRRMFDDIPPPLELQPEQSRRLLLLSITKVIERAAINRPLVLVLEDLQWADEGTLSLLHHLARSASEMRLMVIGTFREGEISPETSLGDTLSGLTRLHMLDRISLGGLSHKAVGDMVAALSGKEPPSSLVNLIYSNTEGNPFFVEELFHHLAEHGKLFETNGDFSHFVASTDIDVPRSVRLVIDRRLARLSDATRRALAAAAVVEGAFTFELLEAASGANADTLLDSMDEAESAGIISSAIQYPLARFRFAHELIRHTLLESYSAARRQRLHLRVADAIEQLHKSALIEHAEDLAHHLWQAGAAADPDRTIRYLKMAGDKAVQGSAMVQAVRHFRIALDLIPSLEEGTERLQQELSLQISLGSALVATKGFAALEVGSVFGRARELSQGTNQSSQLFQILWGQWINYASRSDYTTARARRSVFAFGGGCRQSGARH